jgi:hypothetical protein
LIGDKNIKIDKTHPSINKIETNRTNKDKLYFKPINEDLTLILRKKKETFADTSAFNAGVKEKNMKTNKITIPFLLQNPQWNQRMNSHEPCI